MSFIVSCCKIHVGGVKMEQNNDYKNKELLEMINNFQVNKEKLEINVMFTNSNFKRKEKYKVYTLLTDEEDILPTIERSLENLKTEFSKRSLEEYDLELSIDETVQIVEKDKVINGIELLLKMEDSIMDASMALNEKTELSTLNFLIIQLYDSINEKSLYFFASYVHPTSKFKKASKFTLNGKKAIPFKKDILTVNSAVDAILYDDNYYIFNRKNFNSIFNFKDIFYKIINENKEIMKESNLLADTDRFLKDCMEDGRYLPRLTKVILAKGFETVNSNKAKLKKMKLQYKLSFELTNDGKITYNDKNEITDILNLLLEHFVVSALTGKKMLAKAIEKYKI